MKKLISFLLASLLLTACIFAAGGKEAGKTDTTFANPLQDQRVRQALAYAIDMQTITETIWDGYVTPATKSVIPPGNWQPQGLTDYSYNPEKAKQLLKEANWDSNYVLKAVYYTGNLLDSITAIQAYWGAVGVKMEFKLLTDNLSAQLWTPPADMTNGPSAVDWDICFAGVSALTLGEYYVRFSSKAANNSTIPYDPKIDELVANIEKAVSVEDQKKAFNAMQVYTNEKVHTIPMFYLPNWVITSNKLDMKGNKPGNDQYNYTKNILDWTIDRADKTMYTNTGAVNALEHTVTNPGLFWHQELLFDRLLEADPDLTPGKGMIAESFKVSEDGKKFEFTIRNGVKWHDGKPLTPEDVKWSFEYYPTVPGANAVMANLLKDAKAITINGQKVTFEFNNAQPTALTVFSQWGILPKHLLENIAPANFTAHTFWQNPVGCGPFKVSEVNLGQHTILVRNPDYYKKGAGNIEKIYMYPSTDAGDANLVTNIMAGKIDYAFCKDPAQVMQIRSVAGYKIDQVNVTFTRFAFINMFPRKK